MSSKGLGPTANLIRQSRLMAMPPPLSQTLSDSQLYRLPYPTHQAITTPDSSRRRGDWGLKRPIPRKVESTYIRYNNIDTMEHMTKIESSHDTVLTLKKWQEMDIPLGLRDASANKFTSAFHFDATASSSQDSEFPQAFAKQATEPVWGYREKFVQHMTPGELKTFVTKKLIPRRREFEKFADMWFAPPPPPANNNVVETPSPVDGAAAAEESASGTSQSPVSSPSTQQLVPNFPVGPRGGHLKSVRFDSIQAFNVVREFLQIPLRQVPMMVHPSAGLHYILDSSYLENHPEHGPNQNREAPARLIHKLDSKDQTLYRRRTFYVIGGIVQFAQHEGSTRDTPDNAYSVSRVIRVVPLSANLDHKGKISIDLDRIAPTQLYNELIWKTTEKYQQQNNLERNRASFESVTKRASSPGSSLVDSRGKMPNETVQMERMISLLDFLNDEKKQE
ncbi:hypothetical protein H072_1111 [Dactylellina haptotyla CBS 200.50]|uniref:Uncharacterized protein n=1 Tax=Dactylellina haptotyla (strain CBS 200.50) TaxID=1284197 RepID=S8AVB9_DACHA|nr:hypothetical protein H072_1111 [Dactylellina haptotyla CBS 200.50]